MSSTSPAQAPRMPTVVTLGNPNTGKSTLFNALTGMRQKVGNFPGVTVEYLRGEAEIGGRKITIVDLPGTYSLAAQSPDEMVSVDVLLGRIEEIGQPDAVVVVVDANNLRRNLFLASQILDIGVPVVVALNMMDIAREQGTVIDIEALQSALNAPVVAISAARGEGIDALTAAMDEAIDGIPATGTPLDPALREAAQTLRDKYVNAAPSVSVIEYERALIEAEGFAELRLRGLHAEIGDDLREQRERLGGGRSLGALEARRRYGWINTIVNEVEYRSDDTQDRGVMVDRIVNHPVIGTLLFIVTMGVVFQSVFAWATPLMDAIDSASQVLAAMINRNVESTMLASFLADGVIAGVGAVVVFLPQILILFAFIILLEDTGYMSRAAFLMDRLMRWCGLSGQSFIPMLSSFACAVPGIMGTRVIPDARNRLATILAAPFMTCSARLPVYALLIAAFVPQQHYLGGWLNLQGLVLLAFYLLGMMAGVGTAFLLNRTLLRGPKPTFLLEMPPYRLPNWRSVCMKLYGRVTIFLKRAGTVIFCVAIIVWFLASFPDRPLSLASTADTPVAASQQLENSYLGRASHVVAPLFEPLGWDWKVTAAVIASFPAREVVIAVLGTLYAIDAEDEGSLIERIRASKHADGTLVYSLPMALGLMVFYALCLQCAATVAVMRRETNTWRWPIFAWTYMTVLGYAGAFICYEFGGALLGA